jgi:lipoprotein-releasing system permease protein
VPWYLYLALKQLFPTGKRFPFFTAISILGVSLGVSLLVISTSVMAGFGQEIRQMIVDTQGEVQVRPFSGGLVTSPGDIESRIESVPGVVAAAPVAEGMVVLLFENRPVAPAMRGLDPVKAGDVIPLDRFLLGGSLDALDDDGVILSYQLAEALGARIGDRVEAWSIRQVLESSADTVVLPRELRVVAYFEIGHQQLDSSLALVTLRTMQDLFGLGSGAHGLDVKIEEGGDPDALAMEINRVLPPLSGLRAASWEEANRQFLWVLQLEKNMISFLLMFIIVVAAFSVTSSLLISVVRKTREIGLLGALGGEASQVAACFCVQGFLIGVAGTIFGVGIGLTALHFRQDIVHLFTSLTGSESVLERFYQFSQLPAHTEGSDLLVIVVASVVISTIAGLLPAWRASRLNPVEALRSE